VKRLPALSLLVLVLYNTYGHYFFFAYQSKKEQVAFTKQLDKQSSTFGVIKFNLAIYSSVPETDLECENRDITIEDKTYRIVRRFESFSIIQHFFHEK
jgi:predicted O-linked N-acetylglucosamine transferase (SPINDLY family)